jgi:hypothetical protein
MKNVLILLNDHENKRKIWKSPSAIKFDNWNPHLKQEQRKNKL